MSLFETKKNPAKQLKFSASRAADLCSQSESMSTLHSYIFDIVTDYLDCKKDISTRQMNHGLNLEQSALDILISQVGGEVNYCPTYNQKTFLVNDYLCATPDAYEEGIWTGDAKCQYTIYNFIEQNKKLLRKYNYQLQTQMLSMGVDRAYLINYLSKPEDFNTEHWTEYPFQLEERFHIFEVHKDEAICDEILIKAEKNFPKIAECLQLLQSAEEIDEIHFFYNQLKSKKQYKPLKQIWSRSFGRKIIKFEKEFYIEM